LSIELRGATLVSRTVGAASANMPNAAGAKDRNLNSDMAGSESLEEEGHNI